MPILVSKPIVGVDIAKNEPVTYMVGGYELSHYRKGASIWATTDAPDAKLIARYLKNEADDPHPWSLPSPLPR